MSSALSFSTFLYIFVGGGLGSVLRYAVSYFANKYFPASGFPLGTFLVNIIGCLMIGYLAAYYMRENSMMKFFLITGFCGGFTTFSTFSLENYNLWSQGNYGILALYVGLSLLLGFAAVVLGFSFGRS